MRILIVTHSYAPHVSPRAIRWSNVAERWVDNGCRVHVLTAWAPPMGRREEVRGVSVHRAGPAPALLGLRDKLAGHRMAPVGAPTRAHVSRRSVRAPLVARFARGLYNAFWRGLFWPDYAWRWLDHAHNAATQIVRQEGIEVLVTSSLPFTDHLVGLKLRAEFPDLPWLVDSGDPFSFIDDSVSLNNRWLYRRRSERAERTVLMSADVATVTTELTAQMYSERFPEVRGKLEVVPPLIDSSLGQGASPIENGQASGALVFVGTLYRRVRPPTALLDLFSRLIARSRRAWTLHFVGALNDAAECFRPYERLIGSRILLHGVVDRATAAAVQRSALALINIGNETPYQLPSKLVEYAATGKPVINLARIDADSSVQFLARYGRALSLVVRATVTDEQVAQVEDFLSCPPELDPAANDAWLASFRAEAIASRYRELLNAAITARVPRSTV